jgi:hypothetical protein
LTNKIVINGTTMKNPLLSHTILVTEAPDSTMGNGGFSLTGLKRDDYSPWEKPGPGPHPFKSSAGVYVVKGRVFGIKLPYLSTIYFNREECPPMTPLFTFNS